MTVSNELLEMLNRRQCVDRLHRKNTIKPSVHYVQLNALPFEAACARGEFELAERLHKEWIAGLRRENRLNFYDDLRQLDRSWLTRKFLTLAARARTLLGR